MKSRAWALYLSIGGAVLTAFVFIHPIRVGPLFNLIGLSAPVAIVIAARLHEPRQRLPWYLFALGQALFVAIPDPRGVPAGAIMPMKLGGPS